MDNSDILQRNADGKLEVRVVNGTEKADAPANYDDVFTVNTEGKRALRVVGGGGGGGTGTVTSVNGVQPVDGNVEITGDNITATVGEEEATITQHLTTLKNDEAELGEQVQTNQSDINTLKNQQYPYPEDSEFTVVTLPETAPSNWYRLKLSASVDENATTAIPDGIYGYYAYVKFGNLLSESGSWAEYGKTYAFIKFSVKGGKFSEGEFCGLGLSFVPYIPKQFFTVPTAESQLTSNGIGALANISLDQTAASIIDNKIILAPDYADDGVFGTASAGGTDSHLEAGFTPIRNLETGAELVTSGELVTDIDWETQQILYGTPSPYKTHVSMPATGSVSITTDTSLQGAGTTESPLGISTATMATINGKQDALTAEQLAAVNSGITSAKVASYDAYAGEISTAQSTADKADGAAEVAQQTANLAGQNAAQALSGLTGKVNIAQGADNAGKILGIGADGNVTPVEAPNSGAATLLYYDSTQAPDHSHAMSGVSLEGYGLAGYEVYSNGYVRQWGQDSTSTGTTSVTLPISYTAATTVSMSFFVSVTEVAAAPTGQISAIPVAANQFQVDKPSAICNWETSGYITLS